MHANQLKKKNYFIIFRFVNDTSFFDSEHEPMIDQFEWSCIFTITISYICLKSKSKYLSPDERQTIKTEK